MRGRRGALVSGALGCLLALGGLLGGCSDSGPGRFDDEVRAVREAIDAGNRTAAIRALESLRADAQAAHARDVLDDSELTELEGLLLESRLLVDQLLPPPSTTTTTTTTTKAPASMEEDGHGRDDPPGRGRGRARGHD